ncbi:DNA gyrase inhibitor YacG [Thermodesulfovibrio hydrogeniphilus]
MKMKCPVCGKLFDAENNQWMPFCSKNCKIIDLWNWVHEKYSIKVEEIDEEININEEDKDDKIDSLWRNRKNGQ